MTKQERQTPISVRLEPELTQWVKERAKDEDRSLNAELNRIIRKAKEDEAKTQAVDTAA